MTCKQGIEIAQEFKMRYEPPPTATESADPGEETIHVFDEQRMVLCHWVRHTFALIESVEACLAHKAREQAAFTETWA